MLALVLIQMCASASSRSSAPAAVHVPFFSRLRGGEADSENQYQHQSQQLSMLNHEDFEILEDKVVYSGWRTITQRTVRMRNGKVVTFDVSFFLWNRIRKARRTLLLPKNKSHSIFMDVGHDEFARTAVGRRQNGWWCSLSFCLGY